MRVHVDAGRCQGHGLCYTMYPRLFDEDPYGHTLPYPDELPPDAVADARAAVAGCPESALRLAGTTGPA